jgi:hypothetical protein
MVRWYARRIRNQYAVFHFCGRKRFTYRGGRHPLHRGIRGKHRRRERPKRPDVYAADIPLYLQTIAQIAFG